MKLAGTQVFFKCSNIKDAIAKCRDIAIAHNDKTVTILADRERMRTPGPMRIDVNWESGFGLYCGKPPDEDEDYAFVPEYSPP